MGMTLAVNLMPQASPADFVACARFIDEAGFSHMFVADSSLHAHDVYPYLTLVATNTSRLRLGPLVTHPYTRHPAINLNAMATVNEISGGRALMNIAAGDRPVTELGYPLAKVAVLREAITVIRQLSASQGQPVDHEGPAFVLRDASLRYGEAEGMPLFVTASGPKMLELAGELADGVIFHSGSDERGIAFALDHIGRGAERAGRGLDDLVLGCAVYAALEDDMTAAREACKPIAAWFPQTSPQYARLIGVPDERVQAIRDVYAGGHFDESADAFALVTDEMVDAFALAGDRAHWVKRLAAIEGAGVDFVVVFPMVADKFGMVRRVAADVLPAVRG